MFATMFVMAVKRGPEDTMLVGTNTEEVLSCGYMNLSVFLWKTQGQIVNMLIVVTATVISSQDGLYLYW